MSKQTRAQRKKRAGKSPLVIDSLQASRVKAPDAAKDAHAAKCALERAEAWARSPAGTPYDSAAVEVLSGVIVQTVRVLRGGIFVGLHWLTWLSAVQALHPFAEVSIGPALSWRCVVPAIRT